MLSQKDFLKMSIPSTKFTGLVTNAVVVASFLRGEVATTGRARSDSDRFYSYNMLIAVKTGNAISLCSLADSPYKTTSVMINLIKREAKIAGIEIKDVSSVELFNLIQNKR